MARPTKLSDAKIESLLKKLPTWKLKGGKLQRKYVFEDFVTAFGFMASVALIAERMNHHPEWFNVWSHVHVDLATHDAGGVTKLDFELAQAMEAIAARLPAK